MQTNEENTLTTGEAYFEASAQQIAVEPIVHEEEESHHEEQHALVDFSGLDKPQLLLKLEETVKTDDVQSITGKVRMLREAFYELVKNETESKLQQYLEEGGLKEDFEMRKDAVAEKFESLISQFNKKRSELKVQKERQVIENTATKTCVGN